MNKITIFLTLAVLAIFSGCSDNNKERNKEIKTRSTVVGYTSTDEVEEDFKLLITYALLCKSDKDQAKCQKAREMCEKIKGKYNYSTDSVISKNKKYFNDTNTICN